MATSTAEDTTAQSVPVIGRRAQVRVPLDLGVVVCVQGVARRDGLVADEVRGKVVDLSAGGARLVLPGLWQVGWELVATLELPRRYVVAEGRITWRTMRRLDDNGTVYTEVGLRFGPMPATFHQAIAEALTQAVTARR